MNPKHSHQKLGVAMHRQVEICEFMNEYLPPINNNNDL